MSRASKVSRFGPWVAAVFVVALFALAGSPADAACCSWPTCAVGSDCCNVFCCNCDGPCSNYGCKCPPVAQVGDVCGTCPNYDTCVNSDGKCTGYCDPGYTCCNNGQSCCATSTEDGAADAEQVQVGACAQPESAAGGVADAPRAPQERFDAIDSDGNGSISWSEAQEWFESNGRTDDMDELEDGFRALDANSNESIEPGEFDAELK